MCRGCAAVHLQAQLICGTLDPVEIWYVMVNTEKLTFPNQLWSNNPQTVSRQFLKSGSIPLPPFNKQYQFLLLKNWYRCNLYDVINCIFYRASLTYNYSADKILKLINIVFCTVNFVVFSFALTIFKALH